MATDRKQLENGRWTDGKFEWEYEKDGATLKSVVYLGKFPMISHGWSKKNGAYWSVIFPGTFRLDVPKTHINLGRWWNGLTSNVRHAIKSFRSIKSGFVVLQQQCNDGSGSWWEVADGDSPFYVCALFADAKHIPLPILQRWVGRDGELSGGLIQQLAILLAGYIAPKNLEAALEACQKYSGSFTRHYSVVEDEVGDDGILGKSTLASLTGSSESK